MKLALNAFLIYVLIFIISSQAKADTPFDVEENLISFFPKIHLESGEECQGFRVAKILLATSPNCIQIFGLRLKKDTVKVLDINKNIIGSLDKNSGVTINESEPDLLLSMVNINDNIPYFDTALYTERSVPQKATVYYFDGKGNIKDESVALSSPDKEGHIKLETLNKLPAGVPVLDSKNSLVCLVALDNKCCALAPVLSRNSRTLKSEEDNYAIAAAMSYIIIGAAATVTMAVTSFYLILLVRANMKGMSIGQACQGLCCYGYCSGWQTLSTVFCVIGAVLCPLTSAVCSVPFWWSAAFTAAWNWINSYNRRAGIEPLLPVHYTAPSVHYIAPPPQYNDN